MRRSAWLALPVLTIRPATIVADFYFGLPSNIAQGKQPWSPTYGSMVQSLYVQGRLARHAKADRERGSALGIRDACLRPR